MNNSSIARPMLTGFVSFDKYSSAAFVIYQVIIICICVVGIVGNGMTLFILVKNKVKYAFATYLKALTIADICVLTVVFVRFAVDISGDGKGVISAKIYNIINPYEKDWTGHFIWTFCQNMSAYFTTIISVERFVAVIFPLKLKLFVLDRRPKTIVLVTVIVHVISVIPTLILSGVSTIGGPVTNTTNKIVRSSEIEKATVPFYTIVIIGVKFVIPLIIVVSTTLAIVVNLRRRRIPADHLGTSARRRCLERDKMTVVFIVIAIFFICNTITGLSISAILVFFPDFMKRQPMLFLICRETRLVLLCLNSANDVIVYILSSKKFKQLFIAKFCYRRRVSDNVLPGTHELVELTGHEPPD